MNGTHTITSLTSADGMVSSSFNINDTASSATAVTFGGGTQLSGQESGNATTLSNFYNSFASASNGHVHEHGHRDHRQSVRSR